MKITMHTIVSDLLGIDADAFSALLARGMRPVKAAIRCGADGRQAELFAGLNLATSADAINYAYGMQHVKSCMTSEPVGEFYEHNGIACLYDSNARILVRISDKSCAGRGYGIHGGLLLDALVARGWTPDGIWATQGPLIPDAPEDATRAPVVRYVSDGARKAVLQAAMLTTPEGTFYGEDALKRIRAVAWRARWRAFSDADTRVETLTCGHDISGEISWTYAPIERRVTRLAAFTAADSRCFIPYLDGSPSWGGYACDICPRGERLSKAKEYEERMRERLPEMPACAMRQADRLARYF